MKIYLEELRFLRGDASIGVYIEEPQVIAGRAQAYQIINTDKQKPFTLEELEYWADELNEDIRERILACQ